MSHRSSGQCLYYGSSPTSSWTYFSEGGDQVAIDAVAGAWYSLDSTGHVGSGDSTEISYDQCTPGENITFVQIAAKNGVIYGLDRWGTVHFYDSTGGHGSAYNSCWASVGGGNKNGFAVSIATDNFAYSGMEVWASDINGAIWTAE